MCVYMYINTFNSHCHDNSHTCNHLNNEETEAQKGQITHSGSHSQAGAEPACKHGQFLFVSLSSSFELLRITAF